MVTPNWTMKGKLLIACNCDWGCPCNFNARPTQGHCEGGWTWQIEEGSYGETALGGLHFSLYADWPAAIHEGNGVALCLVDERADERQREALGAIVSGEAGGPWAIFRTTFTTLEGPAFVRYEANFDTQLPAVRAGDVVEVETEHIRNPVTKATSHPRVVLPEGMLVKEAALLATRRFRVRDGIRYDHSGKYSSFGFFQYAGP